MVAPCDKRLPSCTHHHTAHEALTTLVCSDCVRNIGYAHISNYIHRRRAHEFRGNFAPLQWNLSINATLNKRQLSKEDTVCSPNYIELCTNAHVNNRHLSTQGSQLGPSGVLCGDHNHSQVLAAGEIALERSLKVRTRSHSLQSGLLRVATQTLPAYH